MPENDHLFRVHELTSHIKEVLEGVFKHIRLEGEISNFRPSSTGHWYFTLKDDRSAISAVMFKNRLFGLPFKPVDGQLVTVTGNISVYEQRGTYQIICESMKPAGEGAILALLEDRKRRLAAEGLFDPSRKRQIPFLPKRIALITSPTGAAIRDMIQVITRRAPGIGIRVFPAAVQGQKAAQELTAMVQLVNRQSLADLILIGRGGGSLEDLLPFSDEVLVRAVAESHIPVISAVGHETDWSLADFAADLRAPTPSAAAELATPVYAELLATIRRSSDSMKRSIVRRLELLDLKIKTISTDHMRERLISRVQQHRILVDDVHNEGKTLLTARLTTARHKLALLTLSIEQTSPEHLFAKGFVAVTDPLSGQMITRASKIEPQDLVVLNFSDGTVTAIAKEIDS